MKFGKTEWGLVHEGHAERVENTVDCTVKILLTYCENTVDCTAEALLTVL